MTLSAVVLAAGQGTRMKSDRAKVLHEVAGRPLISWVLDALDPLDLAATVVVVGHEADEVAAVLPGGVATAPQREQLGTADAVAAALATLAAKGPETLLVIPGDMPLLRAASLQRLIESHDQAGADATLLSARLVDPAGYGRVVRDGDRVTAIIEDGDADEHQLAIDEVSTSVFVFDRLRLAEALGNVTPDNRQGEYYLGDVIGLLAASGAKIAAVEADPVEASGVNSNDQLAAVAAVMRQRINHRWMQEGVWMLDPGRVYIDAAVQLAAEARLYPDVHLEGKTTVGAGAELGPVVHAVDSSIGAAATVRYAVLNTASVGPGATIGPFTHLRPGSELAEGSKAGTFVEMKNSQVGPGSKVPHLAYVGDTTIGEKSNIGAGTVTVNYDGFEKHRTVIGDRVRIGSDTMLVAPVEIGDDAFTGAGSVITEDVAPGALAIERSQQKEIPGYAEKRKRRAEEEQT